MNGHSTRTGKRASSFGLDIWQEAQRVQHTASHYGFDWENLDDILEKLVEEARELRDAQRKGAREPIVDELGDVLFVVTHYAARAEIRLEDALAQALRKFQLRFSLLREELEREGVDPHTQSVASLERRWQAIKKRLAAQMREKGKSKGASFSSEGKGRSTSGKRRP